jgi:Uma2 family endonuclease
MAVYPATPGRCKALCDPVAPDLVVEIASPHRSLTSSATDGGFTLSKGTALAPDVAFVRADRVLPPASPDYDKPWPLAPDLVVEIASPNQSRPKMAAKVRRYLQAGVRLVRVVWPKRREVDVWRPGDTQPSTTLRSADALEGLDVVPGFSYPLVEPFK